MPECCKSCFYWQVKKSYCDTGTCYRRSPQVIVVHKSSITQPEGPDAIRELPMSVWPATNEKEWCGEHKDRAASGGCEQDI